MFPGGFLRSGDCDCGGRGIWGEGRKGSFRLSGQEWHACRLHTRVVEMVFSVPWS